MQHRYKRRRTIATLLIAIGLITTVGVNAAFWQAGAPPNTSESQMQLSGEATQALSRLEVKGRASKSGYSRDAFGEGWSDVNGCDTRNSILARDLTQVAFTDGCKVLSGVLNDPYTGETIQFQRGSTTSDDVQIDHVVALSDAWQKGAQQLTNEQRVVFANDPLELLAVSGPANQQKSDGDAATWLPSYKAFRCQYVARQIAVKKKYGLWITDAEKKAMSDILATCPAQTLP